MFLSHPLADYVRFKAGISGVKKTSTQSALKRSSLKTTQDIKRQVSHLNMIGCHLTCWVYGKHQGHHHLEHYTSAIKSVSGQYPVIGPIQEVLDAFWPQIDRAKSPLGHMWKYQQGFFFFYFILLIFIWYSTRRKNTTTIWLCIKNWCGMLVRAPEPNDKVEEDEIVSAACVGEQRHAS